MKILLFSDSHGYTQNMINAINKNSDAGLIIHLGDFVRDAIKIAGQFEGIKIEYVQGNNDWSSEYPKEKILDIEGVRILITHGHLYGVKNGYSRLISYGKACGVNAVFFGHTHKADEVYLEDLMILNPGSISMPVMHQDPTYCIVNIEKGKINSRFHAVL